MGRDCCEKIGGFLAAWRFGALVDGPQCSRDGLDLFLADLEIFMFSPPGRLRHDQREMTL